MLQEMRSAQEFEVSWWGNAANTFGEEAKQLTYAARMGLTNEPLDGKWPVYDLGGRSVLDLGGGPVSMLLKCENLGSCIVVDPCPFPEWVFARYESAGISTALTEAEGFIDAAYRDEAWLYNVLQHVESPQAVIETAQRHARVLRIFEWIEMEPCEGHPHMLHAAGLDEWIGGTGTVDFVNENGAVGLAYYGVFDLV